MKPFRFIRWLLILSGLTRWAFVFILLSAVTVTAQTNSEEQAVRVIHHQVLTAIQQHDGSTLQRLLAADFSAVSPDGSLSDKASFIAAFSSPGLPPIEESGTTVRFYGPTALLTTRLTYILNGTPGASFQAVELYAKTGANRELAYFQVTPHQKNALQEVQGLKLPLLSGTLPTYYSPGYEKRAADYQSLLTDCLAFYKNQLGLALDVSLAVLTKEDWGKAATRNGGPTRSVYAVPFVTPPPSVAFLPATDDNVLTADALSYRDKLPSQAQQKFAASGYTFEQGAAQMIGLIGLHELGHVCTNANGIRPRSRWFNEFLASYFAVAFMHQQRPRLAQLYDAMSDLTYVDGERPKHTSLADFEQLYNGVGAKNYDWYQKQFNKRIAQVYTAKGIAFLTDVKKAFPTGEDKPITPEEEMQRLEKICPGFQVWSDRLTQLVSLTPKK